jgi:hypothetical protein
MRELTCASDLVLEAWAAGELSEARAAEVQSHVQRCERCSGRHAAHLRERAEFLEAAPSFDAHASLIGRPVLELASSKGAKAARAPLRRGAAWAAGALSACAALWLVLRPGAETLETRSKGTAHVEYYVKRGSHVHRGAPPERLRAGDQLRFTYSSDRARFFALLDVDSRGARVYYPSGTRAVALAAGSAVPLDFGIELDDSLGSERVYAVFCPEPFELEPLRAELARSGELRAPSGCQVDVTAIEKEAVP